MSLSPEPGYSPAPRDEQYCVSGQVYLGAVLSTNVRDVVSLFSQAVPGTQRCVSREWQPLSAHPACTCTPSLLCFTLEGDCPSHPVQYEQREI